MKNTSTEYSQSSSVHGIQYIFESGTNLLASRIIWVIIVVIFAILGIVWSVEVSRRCHLKNMVSLKQIRILQAYVDWQDNPVLTSVRTTGLPISEIEFPAITICGQGSIYEVKFPPFLSKYVIFHQNNL